MNPEQGFGARQEGAASSRALAPPPLRWHFAGIEKRRPTYDLQAIRAVLGSTETLAMGFDRSAIAETIVGIEGQMFFKSMTTHADHRVWQDVYHVPMRGLTLYVKFQADIVTEFIVMSFKEK